MTSSRGARYVQVENALATPMLVLALIFIPILVLPLAWPSMPHDLSITLGVLNVAIWVAFAAEYVTLLALAADRRRHFRTHLLDLALVALPMFRPLRVLRAASLPLARPPLRANG